MIVCEIVTTCANPSIARAALASIGGDLALRVSRDAAERRLPSGQFTSALVTAFAKRANPDEWNEVRAAVRGSEMPILAGLRYILERGLETGPADVGA